MRKSTTYLLALLFVGTTIQAQNLSVSESSKAAISALASMTGQWEGNGWAMKKDKTKSEFEQTTNGYFKLDSTVLVLENVATQKGKTVVNDMILISYDLSDSTYLVMSYSVNGKSSTTTATLENGMLTWSPRNRITERLGVNKAGIMISGVAMTKEDKTIPMTEVKLEAVKPKRDK